MMANRFDVAAEAPILNTYVPIDFGNLYRIGAALKLAVDEAADKFNAALTKFGEFKAPSTVDTKNWYNLTVNRKDIQDAVNTIATNPDALKDAAFRASLLASINNTDYAALSLLRESAENQRAGLTMRAKMAAENRYKESWDKSNIAQYDTLGSQKVFSDITPVRYMTANELSDAYYNNLKPSSMGTVFVDGVKYDRKAITGKTLYDIANARFNDLVSTPQGKEYYREMLEANGGNAEQAKQSFIGMIADSQRDRIVEDVSVNPYWLAMARYSAGRGSGSGKETIIETEPTRINFLNDTMNNTIESTMGVKMDNGYTRLDNTMANLSKYLKDNPNTKRSQKIAEDLGKLNLLNEVYNQLNYLVKEYSTQYQETGDDESLVASNTAKNQMRDIKSAIMASTVKYAMMDDFKRVAGFSVDELDSKKFSQEGYRKGVKSALDLAKGTVSLMEKDDLLSGVGGDMDKVTDENGSSKTVYNFNSTHGFLLPESVFNLITDSDKRTIQKEPTLFTSHKFPLKDIIESGNITGVKFVPDIEGVRVGKDTFALSGKLRIPKSEIDRTIGSGGLGWIGENTEEALERIFGGLPVTEVKEKGSDDVTEQEYYELDIYKVLPSLDQNTEYGQRVNQRWVGGGDRGLGGASQAKESYMGSAKQLLKHNIYE